jgi:hypothetical protein
MKALIDPSSSVSYIASWSKFRNNYYPVKETLPNSARVCQIELDANIFAVAEPLFWYDCSDQTIPDIYYFDMVSQQFILVPPSAPMPNEDQPNVVGAQTI